MNQPNGQPQMDPEALDHHLDLLDRATTEDLDELLIDLLAHTHRTLAVQNS
jgi:hypothetical protein